MGAVRGRGPADPPFPAVAEPHELGEARLVLGTPNGRPQKVLRIDATGAPTSLVSRLLIGSYITGQDQVFVTARGGLSAEQRGEIRRVVDRLLGTSVVGDSPAVVQIQNFVDPSKYELPRLLHRVVEMLLDELAICREALTGRVPSALGRIGTLEEEVDQLYLLMVRQLLLSSDNPKIARNINVQSHHYQIGYRLVAKVLEVTGDLVHAVGTDLGENLDGLRRMPRPLPQELAGRIGQLEEILGRSMAAFTSLSVVEANQILDQIAAALPKEASLAQAIAHKVSEQKVALAAQRVAVDLVMALEMLVIVNEVTINRSVEPETVALTGARVVSSWACEKDPAPRAPRPVLLPPAGVRLASAAGRGRAAP